MLFCHCILCQLIDIGYWLPPRVQGTIFMFFEGDWYLGLSLPSRFTTLQYGPCLIYHKLHSVRPFLTWWNSNNSAEIVSDISCPWNWERLHQLKLWLSFRVKVGCWMWLSHNLTRFNFYDHSPEGIDHLFVFLPSSGRQFQSCDLYFDQG